MAQRVSGFARHEGESYETPPWVTGTLLRNVRLSGNVVEPACGSGKIARELRAVGFRVYANDVIDYGFTGQDDLSDFLDWKRLPDGFESVVTNPPYGKGMSKIATAFIWKALELSEPLGGQVAMLLANDFDCAGTRAGLFEHQAFSAKITLRSRIRWIEGSTGSPSANHSWFVWDWRHRGKPVLLYADNSNKKSEAP